MRPWGRGGKSTCFFLKLFSFCLVLSFSVVKILNHFFSCKVRTLVLCFLFRFLLFRFRSRVAKAVTTSSCREGRWGGARERGTEAFEREGLVGSLVSFFRRRFFSRVRL